MTAKPNHNLVLVYLGLTLAAAWTFHILDRGLWEGTDLAASIHQRIVTGEAGYPEQYRPLVPLLCEGMVRAGLPVQHAYLLQRLVCWFLAVLLFHLYLRHWLREELCFAGGAILAGLLPFSTLGQGFQPTDPLNLLLFVLSYWLLLLRREAWVVAVVAVGMLNRETIGLVALLAALVRLDEWRTVAYWRLVLSLTVVATAVLVGLHLGYGPREASVALVTPILNVPENLTRAGSLRPLVLYGWLWVLAGSGLRDQPPFLRRGVILIPVFFLVYLCVGLLGETRYFLPLAPVVIPLALRRLFPATEAA